MRARAAEQRMADREAQYAPLAEHAGALQRQLAQTQALSEVEMGVYAEVRVLSTSIIYGVLPTPSHSRHCPYYSVVQWCAMLQALMMVDDLT